MARAERAPAQGQHPSYVRWHCDCRQWVCRFHM